MRCCDSWSSGTKLRRTTPAPVFDSQLTTYANLWKLTQQAVTFITLRRRFPKLLAEIESAKRKLGLSAASKVRSCYEAGRDGFGCIGT
jgi:hypothetical protein